MNACRLLSFGKFSTSSYFEEKERIKILPFYHYSYSIREELKHGTRDEVSAIDDVIIER